MFTLPSNILCGYYDCREFGNQSISPKRKARKFEIELYLEDAKNVTCDNKTYEIKKHYILITKPGQIRHSELPFRTAYIKFNADNEIAERLFAAPEYFRSSHAEIIYNKINELIFLIESENSLLLYSQLLSLLNLILFDSKTPKDGRGENFDIISNAKRYIEDNFDKQIKLKDIAESVHLSETYFHNKFTEALNISPHQYLIKCRIKNAKRLLWDTTISISEVAERSGFGCQQYLNKVFKRETDMTPSTYRKRCQENYTL